MLHHIGVWLGLFNAAGPIYSFWSGFGSDLSELLLLGGVITLYRRHNCHQRWCWRIQRHPVKGTPYVVCRHHHPYIANAAPTAEDIQRASDEAS